MNRCRRGPPPPSPAPPWLAASSPPPWSPGTPSEPTARSSAWWPISATQLRDFLFRKAFQSHQYKYAAAIEEESLTYLPSAADSDSDDFKRSVYALRKAGKA